MNIQYMEQSEQRMSTKNRFGTKFSILGGAPAETCIFMLAHPHYLEIMGFDGNEYALC